MKGRQDWLWPLAHLLTGPLATCWVGSGLARVIGNRVESLLLRLRPFLLLSLLQSRGQVGQGQHRPHAGYCVLEPRQALEELSAFTAVRWPLRTPWYRGGN